MKFVKFMPPPLLPARVRVSSVEVMAVGVGVSAAQPDVGLRFYLRDVLPLHDSRQQTQRTCAKKKTRKAVNSMYVTPIYFLPIPR